jgi:hypothetical protein
MKLTSANVREIFTDCLFKDDEINNEGKPIPEAIMVQGLINNFGFHKERIWKHEAEIKELLDQLPAEFKEGWSFLNMCVDKEGNQWGEHRNMEELVCLGLAINKVHLLMPREMWAILPGGMPYYQIK